MVVKTQKGGAKRKRRPRAAAAVVKAIPAEVREIDELRENLQRVAQTAGPPRWNANPDEVRRSVVKLVLTLVELIRQLLERQEADAAPDHRSSSARVRADSRDLRRG